MLTELLRNFHIYFMAVIVAIVSIYMMLHESSPESLWRNMGIRLMYLVLAMASMVIVVPYTPFVFLSFTELITHYDEISPGMTSAEIQKNTGLTPEMRHFEPDHKGNIQLEHYRLPNNRIYVRYDHTGRAITIEWEAD